MVSTFPTHHAANYSCPRIARPPTPQTTPSRSPVPLSPSLPSPNHFAPVYTVPPLLPQRWFTTPVPLAVPCSPHCRKKLESLFTTHRPPGHLPPQGSAPLRLRLSDAQNHEPPPLMRPVLSLSAADLADAKAEAAADAPVFSTLPKPATDWHHGRGDSPYCTVEVTDRLSQINQLNL